MQGIIWNWNRKLLDIFRQTAKGKRDWFIFFEKSSDKKRFSTSVGGHCVMLKEGRKVRSAKSEIPMRAWRAPHACCFARDFCRDAGNIAQRYFPHNKKEPCDRVRIGCAFALLIWLCLKQGSLLQRTLWSGSYRVRLCTIDLIVFEARKHWLRGSDCTGNVWGSDSVNYLHFLYPCGNSLNQGNINILYWFNASCQLLS